MKFPHDYFEVVDFGCKSQPKNKESTPMYDKMSANYAYAVGIAPQQSLEEKQRERLAIALSTARHEHTEKLQVHFGISDQDAPRTARELVERVKAGDYTLAEEYDSQEKAYQYGWSAFSGFKWRNPKTKFDLNGYEAARKLLDEAYDDADLYIWTLPLIEATDAVLLFKEKKFH